MFTDHRCFAVIVSIISVTGVLFSGQWSTANLSEEVIRSKQSIKTKSCQILSAPNTIYFQKKSGSNKQILTPNTAVDGNAEVVHIECADGARESTSWQGEHYMVCYDGQWYPPNNVCIKLCPAWSLLNSEFSCTLNDKAVSCEKNIRAGTVANRTCKLGYVEQSNAPLSICKDDGEWSQNYLDCFTDCGETDHHYQSNDTQYDTSVAFPWKAGLYKKKSDSDDFEFICSATLVETQYLLTAARCVTDSNGTVISGELLRVGLGKSYIEWNDPRDIHAQNLEVYRATDKKDHKELAGDEYLKLNKSLEFLEPLSKIYLKRGIDLSSFVRPICTVTRKRYTLGLKYTLGVMEYVNGTHRTILSETSTVKASILIFLQFGSTLGNLFEVSHIFNIVTMNQSPANSQISYFSDHPQNPMNMTPTDQQPQDNAAETPREREGGSVCSVNFDPQNLAQLSSTGIDKAVDAMNTDESPAGGDEGVRASNPVPTSPQTAPSIAEGTENAATQSPSDVASQLSSVTTNLGKCNTTLDSSVGYATNHRMNDSYSEFKLMLNQVMAGLMKDIQASQDKEAENILEIIKENIQENIKTVRQDVKTIDKKFSSFKEEMKNMIDIKIDMQSTIIKELETRIDEVTCQVNERLDELPKEIEKQVGILGKELSTTIMGVTMEKVLENKCVSFGYGGFTVDCKSGLLVLVGGNTFR
ncbi:uncharacterized protein LOC111045025 [Nilaparvata lugens]|uniref:uncharacterized protein LOC111045025 n=1 Tax=Nilaparvata lugens TaxID=108931 RepID=UPI00193E02C9|nr:uncharacterized protein LOC111045025 [Nilaparvata lugens]